MTQDDAATQQTFVVSAEETGRADLFVRSKFPQLGRRTLAGLFRDGNVRRRGVSLRKGATLNAGDQVSVHEDAGQPFVLLPDPTTELEIVFSAQTLVAVNKRPGIPSHPLRRGELGTVANALAAQFPDTAAAGLDPREGGLVHRLDTDTSGLLVAARDARTWRALRDQFSTGRVAKTYLAVAVGSCADGGCDEPLQMRGRRAVCDPEGLAASTSWIRLETLGGLSLLRVTARTGRTHQVRAHLAHCGHSLWGDALYGVPREGNAGHFLHAEALSFQDPTSGEQLRLHAALPPARSQTLDRLRSADVKRESSTVE